MDSNRKCLQVALEFYEDHKDFKLWYNGNHVVSIEENIDLSDKGYLSLLEFGMEHLISSFNLKHSDIVFLEHYFANNLL
jgi:hypothetical protein